MFTDHPENFWVITDHPEHLILLEIHICIGFSHLCDTTHFSFPPNFCQLEGATFFGYLWNVAFGNLSSGFPLPPITSKASIILYILTTCDSGSWTPRSLAWVPHPDLPMPWLSTGETLLVTFSKLLTSPRAVLWPRPQFQGFVSIVAQTRDSDFSFSLYPCTNISLF